MTGLKDYQIKDEILETMKKNNGTLYSVIFYLAPGDYHRFHSPCDQIIGKTSYITGKLLPVKESYIESHQSVYESNERICTFGEW